jgi:hypothetical protein
MVDYRRGEEARGENHVQIPLRQIELSVRGMAKVALNSTWLESLER